MKKKPTQDDMMNWWLEPYFHTTIENVYYNHPKKEIYAKDNRKFYLDFAVTQSQHDQWYELAIERLSKAYGWSKKRTQREFAFTYLNVSPSIKKEKNDNK